MVVKDIFAHCRPGNIQFSNGGAIVGLFLCCPGCGVPRAVMFRPGYAFGQVWEWDGNREAPTVTPSIEHPGCWRGWLTNGEFHEH